jgi:uncharacterized membrane protein
VTSSVGFVAGSVPGIHRGPPTGASWGAAATSATSGFPVVGAIAVLFVVVVIIVVLVVVFSRRSWPSRGNQPRDMTEIQRAAAADVAELREGDHYDPGGPGLQPEDDL